MRIENSTIRNNIKAVPNLPLNLNLCIDFKNKFETVQLEHLLNNSLFPKTFLNDFPCIVVNTVMDWFSYIAGFRKLYILKIEAEQLWTAVDFSKKEEKHVLMSLFKDEPNPEESVNRFIRYVSGRMVRLRINANKLADDLFRQIGISSNSSLLYQTTDMCQIISCYIQYNNWKGKGGSARRLMYPSCTVDAFCNIKMKYLTLGKDTDFVKSSLGMIMRRVVEQFLDLQMNIIHPNELSWRNLLTSNVLDNNTVKVSFNHLTLCFISAIINKPHWLTDYMTSTLNSLHCYSTWDNCVALARRQLLHLDVIFHDITTDRFTVTSNSLGDWQFIIESLKGSIVLDTLLRGVYLNVFSFSCPNLVSVLPFISPTKLVQYNTNLSHLEGGNRGDFIIVKTSNTVSALSNFDVFITVGKTVDFFEIENDRSDLLIDQRGLHDSSSLPLSDTDNNMPGESDDFMDLDTIDVEQILLELEYENNANKL